MKGNINYFAKTKTYSVFLKPYLIQKIKKNKTKSKWIVVSRQKMLNINYGNTFMPCVKYLASALQILCHLNFSVNF